MGLVRLLVGKSHCVRIDFIGCLGFVVGPQEQLYIYGIFIRGL